MVRGVEPPREADVVVSPEFGFVVAVVFGDTGIVVDVVSAVDVSGDEVLLEPIVVPVVPVDPPPLEQPAMATPSVQVIRAVARRCPL